MTSEQFLAPLGLSEEGLSQEGLRLSPQVLQAAVRRARSLTGEPGLGIYLGLQRRLAMYGFLGLATMTASTVGEALEGVVAFSHSVSTALSLRLRVEGNSAALEVEEHVDMGDVRDVVTLSFFVGLRKISQDLLGESRGGAIDLAIERPAYMDRFEHVLPNTRYGQAIHRVHMPAVLLDRPLPSPDRATMKLARKQCEQTLVALGFHKSTGTRVRAELFGPRGLRSLEEVAQAIHLSPRTLKRRLSEEATSFTTVRDQECTERARHLLECSELGLAEVADRLGYAALPSFARAFKRLTNETPTQYRARSRRDKPLLT